ncbi:tyrosine-protein phosphatase [Dactylosporangium sp. NPDC000555]|uniref:tyrosine-protein phosphatase n=1 Tax=Dactylosporangium sp. NPDC000555 TaxID=3154260 RepID=UPI0033258763
MLTLERHRPHRPDCRNLRDPGRPATAGVGALRERASARSDSPHRLTAEGLAASRAYGVRRAIDPRGADERFGGAGPYPRAHGLTDAQPHALRTRPRA